ncbi:acyl-CoA carboxylase epsilon subunit [Streptomyces sp. NPDC049687]|uniref:acyl-CoA carboxylase epsilon subunit n=1 Tax=Streptomyces sp. NPDC049687 TaxID=3365596 RepID=UPI0037BDBB8A
MSAPTERTGERQPVIRIERGVPDATEMAALAVALLAADEAPARPAPRRRPAWPRPEQGHETAGSWSGRRPPPWRPSW